MYFQLLSSDCYLKNQIKYLEPLKIKDWAGHGGLSL